MFVKYLVIYSSVLFLLCAGVYLLLWPEKERQRALNQSPRIVSVLGRDPRLWWLNSRFYPWSLRIGGLLALLMASIIVYGMLFGEKPQ